jgi:hypothetical protein
LSNIYPLLAIFPSECRTGLDALQTVGPSLGIHYSGVQACNSTASEFGTFLDASLLRILSQPSSWRVPTGFNGSSGMNEICAETSCPPAPTQVLRTSRPFIVAEVCRKDLREIFQ